MMIATYTIDLTEEIGEVLSHNIFDGVGSGTLKFTVIPTMVLCALSGICLPPVDIMLSSRMEEQVYKELLRYIYFRLSETVDQIAFNLDIDRYQINTKRFPLITVTVQPEITW